MPFNEAFDIIQKLRQASMFGAPPLERQFATPEDTAYIRQNVTDDARRASPPDAAPESSDDDILARIQAMFPQQHEAQDRLRELMNQQPSRNQYKPSFWRRLAAGAVGQGDIGAADRWANKKYYGAEEEWKSRLNPIKELADSEQNVNTNNRSISNQLILNESRQRETDRKTAADKARDENQKETIAQRDRHNAYLYYKVMHPNHVYKADNENNVYSVDPQTDEMHYLTGPNGDIIKDKDLPSEDRLKLQHTNRLSEIAAQGGQTRQNIGAQGTKEVDVATKTEPIKTRIKAAVPGKNTAPVEGSGAGKKEKQVRVIAPDGKTHGTLPQSKLAEYIKKGYKVE